MDIRQIADERRTFWLNLSHRWKTTHWVVGVLGTAMTTLAAAKTVTGDGAPYFSVAAALCIAFIGFANPQKQAYKFISAYMVLDDALMAYDLKGIDEKGLKDEIKKSELIANPSETK